MHVKMVIQPLKMPPCRLIKVSTQAVWSEALLTIDTDQIVPKIRSYKMGPIKKGPKVIVGVIK